MPIMPVPTAQDAPADIYRAPFGSDVLALIEAAATGNMPVLYVACRDRTAMAALDLARFFQPSLQRLYLPGWDTAPSDPVSPAPGLAAMRCAGLARLAGGVGAGHLIVTTASSLVQRVPPVHVMKTANFTVSRGAQVDQDRLAGHLLANGYTRVPTVSGKGEYSIRGGKVDIYPPTEPAPVRIDMFGDEVETIRAFDPETQLSMHELQSVALPPVSEILFDQERAGLFRERYLKTFGSPQGDPMYEAAQNRIRRGGLENWLPLFYERLDTLFDYIKPDTLIGMEPFSGEAAHERLTQAKQAYDVRLQAAGSMQKTGVLPPEHLYLTEEALANALAGRRVMRFHAGSGRNGFNFGARTARNFAPERTRPQTNIFTVVTEHARALRTQGKTVVFAAWTTGSATRLESVLADHGLSGIGPASCLETARKAGFSVCELAIESGFETDDLAIISEADILGQRLSAARRKRKAANFIAEANSLNKGDLIVHIDHGVGRYTGLKTLDLAGASHDCLELEYAGRDKIFLPVENIDLISRYGSEDAGGALSQLGGAGWQARKAQARKHILEMAEALMAVAAARALKTLPPAVCDDRLYEEFAARFAYEETDDQRKAINDVLDDLAAGRPMDRLICGDVGFGKTEIALRAAFIVAMGGQQVAMIAPTTLLARQHHQTVSQRFAGLPLDVRPLSRFVPGREARETRARIEDGSADIIVGTHALLSKATVFKRLGLLIIDEEQRFGVQHKERLKELKADIHVLSLSATPIPRTLQLALTGICDLSIIATPPVDRLAVRTYMSAFDAVTIREALLREIYRGGQGYYVAPRIADLAFLRDFLEKNVPEVKVCMAHGRMSAAELEAQMTAFYQGEYDVLLSTTIIESGLDIPRVNTLIVHKADQFGLAQLYQLRGRVGRSKVRAYAYLTTLAGQIISQDAQRRLNVLQSLDNLGAGFQLASHDLDIRGGGNLLGERQSGHVREVGVELYQSMLEDAVSALKSGKRDAGPTTDDWSPVINLGLSVLIPESYVGDLGLRLGFYRRLAGLETFEGREAFAAELIDRFGPLPQETQQLLDISAIKVVCKALGIGRLEAGPRAVIAHFRDDTPLDPGQLMALIRARPGQMALRPGNKLVITGLPSEPALRMRAIQDLLSTLQVPARCGAAG